MNAVVVTLDCLPLRLLGCYGNLRVRTPHFDRLAAESVVFSQHFAAWVGGPWVGEPWWCADPVAALRGKRVDHGMRSADAQAVGALRSHGVRTLWRGECRDRRRMPADRSFESRAVFLGDDDLDAEVVETPWAQSVDDAVRLIPRLRRSVRSPWLLWLQSAGVPFPWTCPREWLLKYAEVDAETQEGATDDERDAAEDAAILRLCDPSRSAEWSLDEWKLARALCAGCVALLDDQLGRLLAALDAASTNGDANDDETLLVVMAGRGASLSPHADLPGFYAPLVGEVSQTPAFVRLPGNRDGYRCHALAQTSDLWPTLFDWFGVPPVSPGEGPAAGKSLLRVMQEDERVERQLIVAAGRGVGAVRDATRLTLAAWGVPEAAAPHSYHKPEDFWEALDLRGSAPDEVDEVVRRLRVECGDPSPP